MTYTVLKAPAVYKAAKLALDKYTADLEALNKRDDETEFARTMATLSIINSKQKAIKACEVLIKCTDRLNPEDDVYIDFDDLKLIVDWFELLT